MRVLAVTNLYPTAQNPSWGTFVEQQVQGLRRLGMNVGVVLFDRVQKKLGAYLGMSKKLKDSVAAFNPDIVHVMYGGVMAEVVTRVVKDKPVVVSFCGTDLLAGSYFHWPRRLVVKYGVVASHLAAKRAKGIIVKSRNLESALPGGINPSKIRLIPNGVDLNRFQPRDREASQRTLEWDHQTFHILITAYPGHLRKRFDLAQAAVEKLKCEGISAELHQLRGVPHEEVPLWLNASDALLLTSIHEGSPNIVKEALACNRPVVSVDVGDVRERLNGIEGCYVADPNSGNLADKLHLVFNGPRWVNGRSHMQSFSLEQVAHRLQEFYDTLHH